MLRIALLCFVFITGLGAAWANPLAGSWRLLRDRSTDLSGWKALDLEISIDGDVVTLTRKFAAGRRSFEDVTPVDLSKPYNMVPVSWWPDNRHIGAYIGDDKIEKVHGQWLDDGRVFRMQTDLELQTQQGLRKVNILRNFTVSTNGQQLTMITLRSTRNRPVIYVFNRVEADEARTTGTAE